MLYILKNNRINYEKNNYILFNSDEKIKTSINVSVKIAEELAESFNMVPVSPLESLEMLLTYKEVEAGLFYPLPF